MATARENAQIAQQLAQSAKNAATNQHERYMAEAVEKLSEAVSQIGLTLHHMT